jgi:hypothetical protein
MFLVFLIKSIDVNNYVNYITLFINGLTVVFGLVITFNCIPELSTLI